MTEQTQEAAISSEEIVDITTPEGIIRALESLGYEAKDVNGIVITTIQGKFPVAIDPNDGEVKITCELCRWGQIPEANQAIVMLASLEANNLNFIAPFAFGITPIDGDEDGAMFVLVDSISNDFATVDTLDCKMTELLEAVQGSRDVLELAFSTEVTAEATE